MNRKDLAIILGFITIILASTVPFIYNPCGGYVTLFESIKLRLLTVIY